ncbi:hypothetical protein FKP32DRAFT_483796 [Trametes sanguinea]|nr:hypothetical protein FKP32DRAFT_483796 [Trametes sanguinea]
MNVQESHRTRYPPTLLLLEPRKAGPSGLYAHTTRSPASLPFRPSRRRISGIAQRSERMMASSHSSP